MKLKELIGKRVFVRAKMGASGESVFNGVVDDADDEKQVVFLTDKFGKPVILNTSIILHLEVKNDS